MADRNPTADHWFERRPDPPSVWGSVILLAGLFAVFALSNLAFRSIRGSDPKTDPPKAVNPPRTSSSGVKDKKVDEPDKPSLGDTPRLELIAVLKSFEEHKRLSLNAKGGIDLPCLPIAGSKARFSLELRNQVEGQRPAQFRLYEKKADGNVPLTSRPSSIFVEVKERGASSDKGTNQGEFPLSFERANWEQWVVRPEPPDPRPNIYFAPTLQLKPEFWKLLDFEVSTVPLVVRWEHKKESGIDKGQYEIQLTRPGANALSENSNVQGAPLLSSEDNWLRFDFDLGGYESAVAYELTANFPGPDASDDSVQHDWKRLDSARIEPAALEWSLQSSDDTFESDDTIEIAWHLHQRSETP